MFHKRYSITAFSADNAAQQTVDSTEQLRPFIEKLQGKENIFSL